MSCYVCAYKHAALQEADSETFYNICVNNKDKVHVLIKTHYCTTTYNLQMSLAQISPRVGAILEMICLNPDAFSLAKIGTKPSVASILGDTMPPLSSVCSQ